MKTKMKIRKLKPVKNEQGGSGPWCAEGICCGGGGCWCKFGADGCYIQLSKADETKRNIILGNILLNTHRKRFNTHLQITP